MVGGYGGGIISVCIAGFDRVVKGFDISRPVSAYCSRNGDAEG